MPKILTMLSLGTLLVFATARPASAQAVTRDLPESDQPLPTWVKTTGTSADLPTQGASQTFEISEQATQLEVRLEQSSPDFYRLNRSVFLVSRASPLERQRLPLDPFDPLAWRSLVFQVDVL